MKEVWSSTYRKTKRGLPFGGELPMWGGGGGGNLCRVFNLKFCTFRKFSVLLASDMTWAAAGASRPLRASSPRTHRTLWASTHWENLTPHGIELPELILQQKLQFYAFIQSLLPSSFDELFLRNATLFGNLYFMRNLNVFYVPGVRTEFLRRFPFYSFPTAWNFLSSEFKEIAQKSIFKQSLKAKLLDNLKDFQCEKLFCNSCSSL